MIFPVKFLHPNEKIFSKYFFVFRKYHISLRRNNDNNCINQRNIATKLLNICASTEINTNQNNMSMNKKSFKDLYEEEKKKPTSAQIFVSDVAKLTKRSEATVRMWISGRQVPDELAQNMIAEKFNVDVETLFPLYL